MKVGVDNDELEVKGSLELEVDLGVEMEIDVILELPTSEGK